MDARCRDNADASAHHRRAGGARLLQTVSIWTETHVVWAAWDVGAGAARACAHLSYLAAPRRSIAIFYLFRCVDKGGIGGRQFGHAVPWTVQKKKWVRGGQKPGAVLPLAGYRAARLYWNAYYYRLTFDVYSFAIPRLALDRHISTWSAFTHSLHTIHGRFQNRVRQHPWTYGGRHGTTVLYEDIHYRRDGVPCALLGLLKIISNIPPLPVTYARAGRLNERLPRFNSAYFLLRAWIQRRLEGLWRG